MIILERLVRLYIKNNKIEIGIFLKRLFNQLNIIITAVPVVFVPAERQ